MIHYSHNPNIFHFISSLEEVYDRFEISLSFPTRKNSYNQPGLDGSSSFSSNYLSNGDSKFESDDSKRFYDELKRECDQSLYDEWNNDDTWVSNSSSEYGDGSVSLKRSHDDDSDSAISRKRRSRRNSDSDAGKFK